MAKRLETVWDIEPHTAAKHEILKRYLGAWIPILSKGRDRIVYIDGFAGPGEYSSGDPGSPIIALDLARRWAARRPLTMTFLFIEKDEAREANLRKRLESLELPQSFTVEVRNGSCAQEIESLLDRMAVQNYQLAPTFAFLDPFGFSHTPLSLVVRLMSNPRCETLITFMYEEANRFLKEPAHREHFNALFGTADWQELPTEYNPAERRSFLIDLYQRQLHEVAHITFVRSFEMRNAAGVTDYFLFFGTNSTFGLEKMKESMWQVDSSGNFQFSDATDSCAAYVSRNGTRSRSS